MRKETWKEEFMAWLSEGGSATVHEPNGTGNSQYEYFHFHVLHGEEARSASEAARRTLRAFEFWDDPLEDGYSLSDGEPSQ